MDDSKDYSKSFEELEEETAIHAKQWARKTAKEYAKAFKTIEEKLAVFYQQFDSLTGLSMAESRRALDKGELKAFKLSVDEYIELGESLDINFDPEVLKTLKTASLRVRISRLEAIKCQINAEIARLTGETQNSFFDNLGEMYENRYYQTAYTMRSLGFSFSRLNKKQIDAAVSAPWYDNYFISTLTDNKDKLTRNLRSVLTQSVMLGRSYTETIKEFEKRMRVGASNAARLITTESAAISSRAQKDMFEEFGLEKYKVIATLDTRTTQICQSIDGAVFDMKDYQVGLTAPPFHPNCRTTTAPYFEDMPPEKRVARINGKSVYIDNMNYLEWAKAYNIEPVYGLWEPASMGLDNFDDFDDDDWY